MLKKRTYKYGYMCLHFLSCPTKSGSRICRIGGRECKSESTACEKFEVGKFFFCDKRNQWKDLIACASTRQTKKIGRGTNILSTENYANLYSTCTNNCKQGKQIEFLFSKENLLSELSEPEPLPSKIKIHRRIKIKIKRRKI